jgi:hypothetical protein
MIVHAPVAVAPSDALHTSQAPEQALLQQTPSAQKPDVHWSLAVHAPAMAAFGSHWPAWQ